MIGAHLLAALALAAALADAGSFAAPAPQAPADGPDVELHVPKAEVEKLALDVENLQARLDLDATVANLVHISAGVVTTMQKLKLQIEGAEAETHLVVRLDRVTRVIEHALGTIDQHPDIASAPVPPGAVQPSAARPVPAVSVEAVTDAARPGSDP